ncbi:UNVERIFIED_CONTAM: hypothetical protein Sangu_2587500 [Sesamum angustifolium]|uniref:Uncharacterized protein n=1 Tax=Sesamum angustifolium TaxID=2727405 RepID=A0AAW2J6K9_9LAMI
MGQVAIGESGRRWREAWGRILPEKMDFIWVKEREAGAGGVAGGGGGLRKLAVQWRLRAKEECGDRFHAKERRREGRGLAMKS